MTGYELSRDWFDFAFENPDVVNTNHTALLMWIIEKWNRMGQVQKFGLPASEAMAVMGIKNHRTYIKAFQDLVEWGFVKMVMESKNQYTACIVALVKNTKARTKALQRHIHNQVHEHCQSTVQGTVSIIKPQTTNHKPQTTNISVPNGTDAEENLQPPKGEKKETKKSSAKKNKEELSTPHWQELINEWFRFYKEHSTLGLNPTFEGKEAAALKKIVDRLQKISSEHPNSKGIAWDAEYSVKIFRHFLVKAHSDKWRKDNFMLHNLNSHFDAIIETNERATEKQSGVAAFKAKLAAGI